MPLITRTVSNTGDPLCKPDGTPLAGVVITFVLSSARGLPIDAWDSSTGERVTGIKTAMTDASGEFSVALWPTDRSNIPAQYLCRVTLPHVRNFLASLPSGEGAFSWSQMLASGVPLTAHQLDILDTYRAGFDAAAAAAAAAAAQSQLILGNVSGVAAQTGQDKAATAADRTQTGQDRIATAADRIQISQDRAATNADSAQTSADRTQTGQDRSAVATAAVQVALDRAATADDRTQTGQDKAATNADRVQTGQDKTATAADRVQTTADRTQTGLDRVQTGLDRAAAAVSAAFYGPLNPRGAWATATAYALKDLYTSAGIAYVTTLAHTSTSVAADLASGKVTVHQGATREDLALPDGAALVGGVNPIYVLKNHRLPGDSDSVVINKALRKIELDALPGAKLQFECGRTYTYDSTHSLGYINDLDIDLNGALLKRANSSAGNTTLANPLASSGTGSATVVLTSIPDSWQVNDLIAAVIGTNTDQLSNVSRIVTLNRATKTVTLNGPMSGYTGVTTYPAGTTIMKSYCCFAGRPSVADSSVALTAGANKRIRIHGGTIDGNVDNQLTYSWRANSEILLHSEGGAIYDMKFQNTASECIVGHGVRISGNTFVDLGGSALHTSVNDFLVAVATPSIFTGNVVRRSNLKGQLASGHSEGAITFSWGPGHLIITNNLFDGGNEPLLGAFGVSTGANPSRLLIVNGNICKGYPRIFAAVQAGTYGVTLTGNEFHDCGDNTSLPVTLAAPQNKITANAISGNTVLPKQKELDITTQRFGPIVSEIIGGTGPELTLNAANRFWARSALSGIPTTELYQANIVMESNTTNIFSFASAKTSYSGFQWHVAGTSSVAAYLLHDPVADLLTLGSNRSTGAITFKTAAYADHMKLLFTGDTVLSRRAGALYFGDPATDGSWLISAAGADMLFMKRVGGVWVTKQTIVG